MKMRYVAAALCLLGLSACVDAPTAISSDGLSIARDGGLVVGSGHRDGQDSTTTTKSEPAIGKDGGLIVGSGH